ncbi:MAG: ferredoxin [Candidatus Omnitrophota bacterium]
MIAKMNLELCVGCGLCVNTCPEVFEMQEDKAIVKGDAVPAGNEETCRQAKDECPVEAITIE